MTDAMSTTATKSRKYTDEEIRHILDTVPWWKGFSDLWMSLEESTDNEELKSECARRFSHAYHAEEYSADIL